MTKTDPRHPVVVLHARIDQMKARIWWIAAILLPIMLAGAGWAWSVGHTADANAERLEQTATAADVQEIREHQRTQDKAINWIGQSIEKIADNADIDLPARPVIAEPD